MNASPATPTEAESREVAKSVGLRYVSDKSPGIRREKNQSGAFDYIGPDDKPVTDEKTLARIKAIAFPPAYTKTWFCPQANGHLQATGYDAKGRKQYRYHAKWRSARDETKYDRMLEFGDALPAIRARIDHDLSLPGLPREKVLASIVRLLEETRIRIGNEEYVRQNNHFGLTTFRNKHVKVDGAMLRFKFTGKSGKKHDIDLKDRRIARIVQKCQDLPGQDLFEYVADDGSFHNVTSGDVNDYLKEIAGENFTAKDFRTWAGTVLCALSLAAFEAYDTKAKAHQNVVEAIIAVSERLGNTPSVCRKCYVHPTVLDAYLDGSMAESLAADLPTQKADGENSDAAIPAGTTLTPQESAVLKFLRKRLANAPAEAKKAVVK